VEESAGSAGSLHAECTEMFYNVTPFPCFVGDEVPEIYLKRSPRPGAMGGVAYVFRGLEGGPLLGLHGGCCCMHVHLCTFGLAAWKGRCVKLHCCISGAMPAAGLIVLVPDMQRRMHSDGCVVCELNRSTALRTIPYTQATGKTWYNGLLGHGVKKQVLDAKPCGAGHSQF
jgi:hypothetical protein